VLVRGRETVHVAAVVDQQRAVQDEPGSRSRSSNSSSAGGVVSGNSGSEQRSGSSSEMTNNNPDLGWSLLALRVRKRHEHHSAYRRVA
jgi:hypothetical protein